MPHKIVGGRRSNAQPITQLVCIKLLLLILKVDPYFEISPTRGLSHEIGQVLSADL